MHGRPTEKLKPGTPQNVADVLRDHVVLELEGIDRMYLNVYVPRLQALAGCLRSSASTAASLRLVGADGADEHGASSQRSSTSSETENIPMITFEQGPAQG